MSNTIIYNDGELELNISIKEDNIWITQKQLANLFKVEVHTINYHIKNIFKQNELEKNLTIRKIRIVQNEGKRQIKRDVEHYNLDMIISVGYRINSFTATKFRQWATSVLKNYIHNGYAINEQKITHQRIINLENDVASIKTHIKNNTLQIDQGIFYDGQIFDAYSFVNDLIR